MKLSVNVEQHIATTTNAPDDRSSMMNPISEAFEKKSNQKYTEEAIPEWSGWRVLV